MKKKLLIALLMTMALNPLNAQAIEPDPYQIILGDPNFDDKIDASDATEVLQEYAALSVGKTYFENDEDKKLMADINGDNKVDAADATQILEIYSYNSVHDVPMETHVGSFLCTGYGLREKVNVRCKTWDEVQELLDKVTDKSPMNRPHHLEVYRIGSHPLEGKEYYNTEHLVTIYESEV